MPKPNIADQIAAEIEEWLDTESAAIAEALLGSALAPAVVQPPRAQALAYFRAKLFTPNGLPNPQGRDELLARYGPQGYQDVALAVAGEPVALPEIPQEVV